MNKLKEYLIKYRELTIDIIDSIEKEDYDELEKFLAFRQDLIEKINDIQYEKQQFINISKDLELMTLEEKLNRLFLSKKRMLKQKLNNSIENKEVSRNYNRVQFNNYNILNKKI